MFHFSGCNRTRRRHLQSEFATPKKPRDFNAQKPLAEGSRWRCDG